MSGEYLTVADAMKQVLDLVSALEEVEAEGEAQRSIVWRLVDAHTNSPPFTIVAEAFPKDPQVSVAIEANRVLHAYSIAVASLLDGERPRWLPSSAANHLKRAFKRNLNGIGHTDVVVNDEPVASIVPARAAIAVETLERSEKIERTDYSRTEFGSIEGQVIGLTRWYSSPALIFQERLSSAKVMCVLDAGLAEAVGPAHNWAEAWNGRDLRVSGEIFYAPDGLPKRVRAVAIEQIEWTNVPVARLQEIDGFLGDRSVQEHLDEFWGEQFG